MYIILYTHHIEKQHTQLQVMLQKTLNSNTSIIQGFTAKFSMDNGLDIHHPTAAKQHCNALTASFTEDGKKTPALLDCLWKLASATACTFPHSDSQPRRLRVAWPAQKPRGEH